MVKKQIATFLGAGETLSIYGNHCSAYSGAVSDPGSGSPATKMLDFHSGKGYIKAKLQFAWESSVSQIVFLKIVFNGVTVLNNKKDASPDKDFLIPVHLIIPSNTRVQVYWGLDNDTINGYAILTGRVYA